MSCVPAPVLPSQSAAPRQEVAARLIRLAQEAELAGQHLIAVSLVDLVYAVLDGTARQ